MKDDLRSRYGQMTELVPFPKLAQLIGIYTAHFARLELSIWTAYGIVLQMEEDEAMVMLGDLQSFATKLSAVERLLIERRNHIEGNYLLKLIFEKARSINTFRNKLSHGLYLTDKNYTKVFVLAFASDPKRQIPISRIVTENETNYFELSEKLLQTELDKISEAMKIIGRLIKWLKPNSVLWP